MPEPSVWSPFSTQTPLAGKAIGGRGGGGDSCGGEGGGGDGRGGGGEGGGGEDMALTHGQKRRVGKFGTIGKKAAHQKGDVTS